VKDEVLEVSGDEEQEKYVEEERRQMRSDEG